MSQRRTAINKPSKDKMHGTEERPKEPMTQEQARRFVRYRVESGAAPGSWRAYPCDFCPHWHAGHTMPPEKRLRRRSGSW